MPRPRNSRSARRNAQRTAKNQAARAAVPQQAEPRPERARYVTQLELLRGRASISEAQYEVGDRLYREWRASGSEPCLVAVLGRQPGREDGITERQAEARSNVTRALRYVGPLGAPVLVHVCLVDAALPAWEAQTRTKRSHGITVLRMALDHLAAFYREEERRRRRHDEKRRLCASVDIPARELV